MTGSPWVASCLSPCKHERRAHNHQPFLAMVQQLWLKHPGALRAFCEATLNVGPAHLTQPCWPRTTLPAGHILTTYSLVAEQKPWCWHGSNLCFQTFGLLCYVPRLVETIKLIQNDTIPWKKAAHAPSSVFSPFSSSMLQAVLWMVIYRLWVVKGRRSLAWDLLVCKSSGDFWVTPGLSLPGECFLVVGWTLPS